MEAKVKNNINRFIKLLEWGRHNKRQLDGYVEIRMLGEATPRQNFVKVDKINAKGLAKISSMCVEEGYNCYLGYTLRDSKSGKKEDCKWAKVLVLDFDEIEGEKIKELDGDKRKSAKQELLEAIKDLEYKPSMIVNSGNGFHAYYKLEQALDLKVNQGVLESKVKGLSQLNPKIPGDTSLANVAQPIRMPGSLNVKDPNNPLRCEIVEYNPDVSYKIDELPDGEVKAVSTTNIRVNTAEKDYSYPFWSCKLLRDLRDNPAKQSYRLWQLAASNLSYFEEEGREAFHELSRGYPKYKPEEADRLFDNMQLGDGKAARCETFEEYGLMCDRYGKCKAFSPKDLVKRLDELNKLRELGFEVDYGKLKYKKCNENKFAEYINQNFNLLFYKGALWYFYNEDGYWEQFRGNRLERMIRDTLHSAKDHIWTERLEKRITGAMEREVDLVMDFDSNENLINVKNGMLDIKSKELVEHDPKYYSKAQLRIDYDPSAKCPKFKEFLDDIMEGDQERIRVIQEVLGYAIAETTKAQKGIIFYGSGRNGKSTLNNVIRKLVGKDNVSSVTLGDLSDEQSRLQLVGKKANIADENELKIKSTSAFKNITDGGELEVKKLYEDKISEKLTASLIFAVNKLPDTIDSTLGFFRRLLIIPFNKIIPKDEIDRDLGAKLEEELAGILNFALDGLDRLRKNNYQFSKAEKIDATLDKYNSQVNIVAAYIEAELSVDENKRASRDEIKDKFESWCKDDGFDMSNHEFWGKFRDGLESLGINYQESKSNGKRYFEGVYFKDDLIIG